MKQANVFLAVLITISFAVVGKAANYFEVGTVWTYKESVAGQVFHTNVSLIEAKDVDGNDCYMVVTDGVELDWEGNVKSGSDHRCEGPLLKVDGERVYYFNTKEEVNDWDLAYDFSLVPGEGCFIKEWINRPDENNNSLPQREYYFKFDEMVPSVDPSMEWMVMKVFRTKEDSAADTNAVATEYWLPGIGDSGKFLGEYFFPDELSVADYSSSLIRVIDKEGNTVYGLNSSICPNVDDEAKAPVDIYDLFGRRIHNPTNGVFIRVKGSEVSKVRL